MFSIQTERTVGKDNTVAIGDRHWQLDKTSFRRTLAGCTVTICEHLDQTVSVRWGPHLLQQFDAAGEPLQKKTPKRRGKGGIPTAPTTAVAGVKSNRKRKTAHAA